MLNSKLNSRILSSVFTCAVSLLLTAMPVPAEQQQIRVALYIDGGTEASEFRKEFKRNDDESICYKKVSGEDVRNGYLKEFDVFLMPGGSSKGEAQSLGPEAREQLKQFISNGGIYMGVCAGAYLVSCENPWDLGILPLKCVDGEHWFRVDPDREATVNVELTPVGMEIFGVKNSNIQITYCNGPIFAAAHAPADKSLTPLGFFRSEVVADGGQRGAMLGAPAMVLSRYGEGIILAISPHPEETPGLKQTELHAIRWLFDHRNAPLANAGNQTQDSWRVNKPLIEATGNAERTPATNNDTRRAPEPEQNRAQNRDQKGEQNRPVDLSRTALSLAESIFDRASVVQYVHKQKPALRQIVSYDDGTVCARTDCSGFISYIVRSVAPRHYEVIRDREPGHSYPQAKVWASFFGSLDSRAPRDGWLGISNWQNLSPGDFIAWKEGGSGGINTGHVMMAVSKPSQIQETNGYRYFDIEVIDSSSVYHFPPEYLPPKAFQKHRNGLGVGRVRIILNESNNPIGYWAGTFWGEGQKPVQKPTLSKEISFARMVSLRD